MQFSNGLRIYFLSFSDSWRSLDHRMLMTAQCLGSSPLRNLFRIKLPVLFKPLLVTMAIGLSVSIAQYLPTLFAGGGRFSTLTTEAVSYASSGDMRVIGVFAFLQSILPLIESGKSVQVNLSKVDYMDSSGISVLIEGKQLAEKKSTKFELIEVSKPVEKVLSMARKFL